MAEALKPAAVKKAAVKKPAAKPRAKRVAIPVIQDVTPLLTPAKRDFTEAKNKYVILDPDKLQLVERDEFVKKCVGQQTIITPLEDIIVNEVGNKYRPSAAEQDMFTAARHYKHHHAKNARLPKFSKWLSSMYASNKEYAVVLSTLGNKGQGGELVISDDVVDILRGGEGPHLGSCLGANGMFSNVLQHVVEKAPGIFVAYIDHPQDGKMKWRSWLHHIKVDGEDAVGAMNPYGRGGKLEDVAAMLATKGMKLYLLTNFPGNNGYVPVKPVDCFKQSMHWDLHTQDCDKLYGKLVVPSVPAT